jgi:threonyl-tRNA synthetase
LLAKDVVAARVNLPDGVRVVDLHTPLPAGTPAEAVSPVRADDPAALEILRHSAAHVMADAVQRLFPGTQVTIGPAIDAGFYYDFSRADGRQFSDEDLEAIEAEMRRIAEADYPFRREVVSREDAVRLFESMGERFKLEIIDRAQGELTLYRHGRPGEHDWVDFCAGPHVPSTRFLGAVKLTHVAGAYWRGDERNPMLQRIYGTAFHSRAALEAHLQQVEEAKKRDHRRLGKELGLVAFHPWAPASPFFLPRGARVYNALVDYVRGLYGRVGYDEVITPQVFDAELFRTSGHLPNYAENMFFAVTAETLEDTAHDLAEHVEHSPGTMAATLRKHLRFGVKPMNCPAHALLFGMTRRSYRELPMRMADFGRLHRFERSGVVQGLTRVRTFAQDDAHIFCTEAQIGGEIARFLDLVYDVYRDFGFSEVRVVIATRPPERLGSDAIWDRSERALEQAVRDKGLPYEIAEGEGAFYGPKIEFHLKDALGRPWQLGTMQADFNLPERFDLTYVGEDNAEHRPVMLHRAILGSVERFFGVLVEHVGGAFPTWLAPEQITLLTVSEKVEGYAREAAAELERAGLRVTLDLSGDKLGAKIRAARLLRVPYLGVVGQKEADQRGLSLRSRDEDKDLGFLALGDVIARLAAEALPPSRRSS